ncbi:MAG TPA: nuclear transport factor 2 family protein [Chitinophagaceae bacterium]|nr:nuclear transport factor 2 family protein [Chitinophagaceae bacterium]
MKKTILVLMAAGFMASCNSNAPETPAADTTAVVVAPAISYPYTAKYSSDFSMGKPELIKVVLDMYKAVEDNKMDDLGKYYADSVIRYNFAQKEIKLTREEMVKLAKDFRAQFKEFSETPVAFTALHSNDKNEDWVVTWIKEKVVYNNGKVDSTTYQENWRFRDGKIYMVDSYAKYAK